MNIDDFKNMDHIGTFVLNSQILTKTAMPMTVEIYNDATDKKAYQVCEHGGLYRVADCSAEPPVAYFGQWLYLDLVL